MNHKNILKSLGKVFLPNLLLISCCNDYSNKELERLENMEAISSITETEFVDPSPFLCYDLYKEKHFEKRTLLNKNTRLEFYFSGNIDFLGARDLSLEFIARSKKDTIIKDFDLGSLEKYDNKLTTNYDKWFKTEYEGYVGEILIEESGDFMVELNLILGKSIITVNKAQISIIAFPVLRSSQNPTDE